MKSEFALLAKLAEQLLISLGEEKSASEKLSVFLDRCEKARTAFNWSKVRALNVEMLCDELSIFIAKHRRKIVSNSKIKGVLWGIQTPCASVNGAVCSYDLQVELYADFTTDDMEWASEDYHCNTLSALNSKLLRQLFDVVQALPKSQRYFVEVITAQAFTVFAIESALKDLRVKRDIGNVLCWAGGDGLPLGSLTARGYKKPTSTKLLF